MKVRIRSCAQPTRALQISSRERARWSPLGLALGAVHSKVPLPPTPTLPSIIIRKYRIGRRVSENAKESGCVATDALSRWHGEEGIEMSSPLLLLENKVVRGSYLDKQ
jgi:hypothetical protein